MRNIFTIFSREIKAFFSSPIAYIFIVVFLFISVGMFMTQFFIVSDASMRGFFYSFPMILCIFLPAITMRLWSEDRKGNTMELLLTFPIKTHELVIGKFLASFVFYIIALISTLTVPIMIMILGKPDTGVILCQYLGAILLGGFFLSLGVFVSGFCKDQIVSFILSMMACFMFFMLGTDFAITPIDGWIPGLGTFFKNSLGMVQHFASFQKGVIDARDLLYFIIGTVIFLTLNGFWLETRLKVKAKSMFTAAGLISLAIFIVVNLILIDMPIGRSDFTEGRIYTISKATGGILEDLKAPITVKLYISPSDKMPSGLKTLERDVRDKLDEFKIASKGNFNYKVFHLEAANVMKEEEDSLEKSIQKKGVKPFQVRSVEADEVGVKLIYSALSIAYKEKSEEIIPRVMPGNLLELEYLLISKIYKMTLEDESRVALVAPFKEKIKEDKLKDVMEELGDTEKEVLREDDYEYIVKLLEYEGYAVSRIDLSRKEPIPDGTDTLIVIEPKELNDRQRYEINKFLVNGGSVFLGIQNNEFEYTTAGPGTLTISAVDKKPEINTLLEKWGLGVNKDILMDTNIDIVQLTGSKLFGIIPVSAPVKLPMQIKIIAEQMNRDLSITSRLDMLFYLWGSALNIDSKKIEELKLKKDILFTSSKEAWEVKFHEGELTNEDLSAPSPMKQKTFPLAVLVQGQFPDAYDGKDAPRWPQGPEGEESYDVEEKKIGSSPKPGKLILTGCSKMLTKELFDKGGHMSFLLNSIDTITLGEKLIGVRSKQSIDRTLKRLSSASKAWWRVFSTFLVPIGLCVLGAFRIIARKRSKWAYLKSV
ncbi:MAG: Gldg family protein [Candidatus Omnitrophota bacterium]